MHIPRQLLGDGGSAASPATSAVKAVVAHFIVGFTISYSQADWLNDITQASAMGIDAFALNFGSDPWQPNQIANAYAAAAAHGSSFKLFLSFDMTSIPCASAGDAANIGHALNQYASHPSQFWYKDRPYTSTFGGERCTFGTGDVNSGWTSAVRNGVSTPYSFVPGFFTDPNTFGSYPVVDGEFNWNGAWPMSGSDETFDSDGSYIASDNGKLFMAAASPWFFAHYPWKNEVFRSSDWLWNTRWDQIIAHRDQVDIVEIVTWNDYSESHYIGPVTAAASPPGGTYWQNGYDHQGWLNMVPYYAQAFKTGANPTISTDHIYIWSRPHPADATACCDGIGKPANAQWESDNLWAVVFASSTGTVTLTSGSNVQSFEVPAGVTKLQVPSAPGGIRGTLTRLGAAVVDVNPGAAFTYTLTPQQYNYNAFVAWA
ncbi:glycoside hydrolase family 71 protein [Punctularia strigosozonata HHB-11173 SS5]|uniref:Glycoside hydrolase family 71 protein n=1 Tax=Punctularia strigosozonata (strain HHB-11173) TaxID=741275 RepID=R7S0Y2_PUNST|nr:glycoside hydrolase family 71 protein [Punctularia strigosozonata HHB-11173 SS5]EIN03509.1 glycoside hydrolase family 71 protein [Punctularia strigosozonata HHB-11173 SS5]